MSDASIAHLTKQINDDSNSTPNNSAGPRSQAQVEARQETARTILRKNIKAFYSAVQAAVAEAHDGVGISTKTFYALKKEVKLEGNGVRKNALNGVQLVSTGRHKGKPYSMKPDAIRKRAQAAKEREAKAAKKQPVKKPASADAPAAIRGMPAPSKSPLLLRGWWERNVLPLLQEHEIIAITWKEGEGPLLRTAVDIQL